MESRYAASVLHLALGLACISSGLCQASDPVEELKGCAKISDPEARFACYDALGKRVLGEEPVAKDSPPEKLAQATTPATKPPSLPDNIGGPDYEDPSKAKAPLYEGVLTSCTKGRDGKWFFYFDNGQVWKQTTSRMLRFKECNSNAIITRDGFGYKLQMDGDKRKIRVGRKR